MKHKMYNRFLSLALALALVVGMLPGMTFAGAVDTTAPQSQAEQVEQIAEPTEEPETVSEENSQAEVTPTPAPESSEEESSQVEETPAPTEEPVQEPENNEDTESAFIPPVNFSNVAPLTDLNSQRTQMMMANAISPTEGEETAPDGLEISKNIYWDNEEHTYKIKLEAYTTGDITVSGGDPVPADIVLVLDQSGSMSESFGTMTGYYSVADNNSAAWNHKQNLYVKIGDEYIKVNVERSGSGYRLTTYTYTYTYNGQQYEYTGTYEQGFFGGDDRFPSELAGKLYFYGSANASRQEAMKQAVNNFIDSVHDDAVKNSVDHKISIVKFAGDEWESIGNETYTDYNRNKQNYSQIVVGLTSVSTGANTLTNAVNQLNPAGATRVDHGLSRANAVFQNAASAGRNRIVVTFTDGEPSSYSGYDRDVANAAISQANTLKNQKGATIYSVGVFSGADGSNPGNMSDRTSRPNRFMHLISSNYPFATSMDSWDWGSLNPELEGTDKSYYLSASDTETLNEIFEKISDEVQGGEADVQLDANAVIKDVMSDYFEVATDNTNDIEVSFEQAVYTNGQLSWTQDDDYNRDKIRKEIVTENNKQVVNVSGFDFNHNFVSPTGREEGNVEESGDFHGRKIVITFPIEVKDGFLGGNNVPTNDSASGIYKNADAQEPIGRFNEPNLNVAIEDYTLTAQNKTIHLTTSTDANGLFSSSLEPDGWNNHYVDIVYTIKNGETVVGTYTIEAGQTTGTWRGITDGKLKPENCTDYTITCTVSPTTNNEDSVSNSPVVAVPENGSATVHVLIPKVSVKDSEINLGQTADFSDNYNAADVKNQWVDRQGHTDSVPPARTAEPEVDLSYQFVWGSNPGDNHPAFYQPTQDSDFKIVVKIGDRILRLTEKEYTLTTKEIYHDNCIEPTNGNDHDFTIHVHTTNGMLVIQKEIEGGLAANGEPVFDFKVESPNGTVYYYHVIGQADGTVTATPEGGVSLPAGDYTVTELYNQNYKATGVQITGGDQTTTTPGNNYSVTVSVKPNGTTTVTFTNTADDTKIPSDSGATQNNPNWGDKNNLVGWKPDDNIKDGNVQTDETSN